MNKRASVLFYVQHLLGIGHIRRIASIAHALAARGPEVVVASGGFPLKNLDWGQAHFCQLPPVRSNDTRFSTLVDEHGVEIEDTFKVARRDQLLDCFNTCRPDVVILETFPFGRRQLRFELLPLLDVIHKQTQRPKLLCSIRDVLQLKKKKRRRETLQILNDYFDAILVHGDAHFIALQASFPETSEIKCEIAYTGYVVDDAGIKESSAGENEIVVAAGGGAAAGNLYRCAIAASQYGVKLNKTWRLLVSSAMSEVEFEKLRRQQSQLLIVERNRNDYRSLLKNCVLSISQAGYNTFLDVVCSGVRALFVPFEGEGETEQITRASRLHELGRADLLRETELTAQSLCHSVSELLNSPPPKYLSIDIDGTNRSTEFILNQLRN